MVAYSHAQWLTMQSEMAPRFAKLEAEIARLRAEAAGAAKRGYDAGYTDGYRVGALDALDPMSPDHARALAVIVP